MKRRDSLPRTLRIVLAAGGTGGHLMPALATAEALERRLQCKILVLGSSRVVDRQLRGFVRYEVAEVNVRPLAGLGLVNKLRSVVGLVPSIARAAVRLRRFRPDVVIATGGYVCGPTGIAAWLLRFPLLVMEQNATPGLTTRWLRPFARAIAVSFEPTRAQLGPRAVLTGNPVRAALASARSKRGASGRRPGEAVRLLVLGGSQGSSGLNTMIQRALRFLAQADVGLVITHQTGARDVEALRAAYAEHGVPATVVPFINNMAEAYRRADLVCARAGATTAAELLYCGLPAVLVPFPHAAGNHQGDNADAMVQLGAAVRVDEGPSGEPLAEAIRALAADPAERARMSANSIAAARADAADIVADLALSLLPSDTLDGIAGAASDELPADGR